MRHVSYGALGRTIRSRWSRLVKSQPRVPRARGLGLERKMQHTLFGRYEVILAVKTILPLVFNLMNILAAAVAQFQAPYTFNLNSCSTCAMVKSSAGRCLVIPAFAIMPSNRPALLTISSNALPTDSSEVTSVWMYWILLGYLFCMAAKSSPGAEMSREKTWAALLARHTSASPNPIPWLAPVTWMLLVIVASLVVGANWLVSAYLQ